MTTRLCSALGCYNAAGRTGRCTTHARELAKVRDPRSTTERGYGALHQKLRLAVLAGAGADKRGVGGACWICAGPGTAEDPLQADHLIPTSLGGTTTRQNLAAAHRSCNIAKGGRNRQMGGRVKKFRTSTALSNVSLEYRPRARGGKRSLP